MRKVDPQLLRPTDEPSVANVGGPLVGRGSAIGITASATALDWGRAQSGYDRDTLHQRHSPR